MFSPADTIVAIATASGRAGLGVIRVSGPGARAVARAILSLPDDLKPRRATLTRVIAEGAAADAPGGPGGARAGAIDEVVATFFPGPHSYTAEDTVEISGHGSPPLLREIVRAAMRAGARLAEPGEFTLRAFLNGRLDLVQAEAVGDLVDAVTPLQARVAFDQLEGTLTRAIGALDAELFDLVAKLEASLDFPEEGYHFIRPEDVEAALRSVGDSLRQLLATARVGRVIREGRQLAVLGKPNVGKSSLFNELVGADRAIVSRQPGTTRDLVTENIDFEGVRLNVVDTAGIREVTDEVEQEGVTRARRAAAIADLVLVVLDMSRPLEAIDTELLRVTAQTTRVIVCNKADLSPAWDASGVAEAGRAVVVSLKTGVGVGDVRAAMRAALDVADPLRDEAMISNLRHEGLLKAAAAAIERALDGVAAAGPRASEELVLADLAEARRAFEEVTGKRTAEDTLRHIFERFCVGK